MSSRVVELRSQIMEEIRAKFPQLNSVDWHDGVFNVEDIEQWILECPAAKVTITRGNGFPLGTGEVTFPMRVTVAIICVDGPVERDSDFQVWEIMEAIVGDVQWNKLDNYNSAPANAPRMDRVGDPTLRERGVALGFVEWEQTIVLGTNSSDAQSYFYDDYGNMITQVPGNVTVTANHLAYDGSILQTTTSVDVLNDPTYEPAPVNKVVFPPSF